MALYGIDISKWQNTNAVDQAQDFVIIKATEGTGYVDPTCDTKYQYAKSKGKLLGVYHFARPDLSGAVAEAEFFVNNTEGYWKPKEAILVLDWETGNKQDVSWALTWLRRVYEMTGVRPLIYMSASVIRSADWSPVVNEDFGLWVAGYPSKYNVSNPPVPGESEMPYDISPWPFSAIWQYTSSAGTLDRDIAHMSAEAWSKYAGKSNTPQPKIEVKDEVVLDEVVHFSTERKDDPTLTLGDQVEVVAGVDGRHTVIHTITYTNGVETQRVVKSDITVAPINQVVRIGTKEPEVEDVPKPDVPPTPQGPEDYWWLKKIIKLIVDFLSNKLRINK